MLNVTNLRAFKNIIFRKEIQDLYKSDWNLKQIFRSRDSKF